MPTKKLPSKKATAANADADHLIKQMVKAVVIGTPLFLAGYGISSCNSAVDHRAEIVWVGNVITPFIVGKPLVMTPKFKNVGINPATKIKRETWAMFTTRRPGMTDEQWSLSDMELMDETKKTVRTTILSMPDLPRDAERGDTFVAGIYGAPEAEATARGDFRYYYYYYYYGTISYDTGFFKRSTVAFCMYATGDPDHPNVRTCVQK
jgi:hypothetical protein